MDHRHLWLRSTRQHAILRVRARDHRSRPRLLRRARLHAGRRADPHAERLRGHDTLFETDYFGEQAYLTQSGQLYMEAGALAFGKVYCFGPTFRAEKSKTRRHLTEFWMVEPEVAFMDLAGDMDLAEDFLGYIVGRVLETRREELDDARARRRRSWSAMQRRRSRASPTTRRSRSCRSNGTRTRKWGDDFGGDEETVLSSQFDRPVIVHRYPARAESVLHEARPERPEVALCVDVLAPEGYGEIIGGGQREDDLDTLERDRGARAAARGASSGTSTSAATALPARRLRDGHRAHGRLDLRPAPRARDDPVSASAR